MRKGSAVGISIISGGTEEITGGKLSIAGTRTGAITITTTIITIMITTESEGRYCLSWIGTARGCCRGPCRIATNSNVPTMIAINR